MAKQDDGTEAAKRDADGNRIRLAHPRWRAILMQSTIEYATQFVLFKGKVNAQVKVLQEGSIDEAIGQSAMVGVSTSDDGLVRMRQIVDRLYELGNGQLRTSDVTGMDWSVGALGGFSRVHNLAFSREAIRGVHFSSDRPAHGQVTTQFTKLGMLLYGQTRLGTVQTGMLCTSQEGGAARVVDSILKNGVIDTEEGLKPAKAVISYSDDKVLAWGGKEGRKLVEGYCSPLDERDILLPKKGEPFDFLGRFFETYDDEKAGVSTLRYKLKRWEKSWPWSRPDWAADSPTRVKGQIIATSPDLTSNGGKK